MTTNDNIPAPSGAAQPLAEPATASLRFEKRIDKSFWNLGMDTVRVVEW